MKYDLSKMRYLYCIWFKHNDIILISYGTTKNFILIKKINIIYYFII